MDDPVQASPWLIAAGLRPAVRRGELCLAAKLECARGALLYAEDALVNGLVVSGRKLKLKVRDELILAAVRNALGLIGGCGS